MLKNKGLIGIQYSVEMTLSTFLYSHFVPLTKYIHRFMHLEFLAPVCLCERK